MAVGIAVASGLADAGLGVRAAAVALGLDFVPVSNEQYDLAIARSFFDSDSGQKLLEILCSDGLKRVVGSLGGYDPARAGEILHRQ